MDALPVTGVPGTMNTFASEVLLRFSYPFLFSGPLPVTGVIVASATQSDLRTVVSLPTSYGRWVNCSGFKTVINFSPTPPH